MEGVSGIVDQRLITTGDRFWHNYGRYLLTEDVNVVALAAYSKGFKRILLSENHDYGRAASVCRVSPTT
jgi:D-aminopeptidase